MSEPNEPKPGMPPTPDNANRDVLTFEEFISRDSHGAAKHNNFYMHFEGAPHYVNTTHYRRFTNENPDLAASLSHKIRQRDKRPYSMTQQLQPFEQDLYEAYKIMRSYGVSDRELFA